MSRLRGALSHPLVSLVKPVCNEQRDGLVAIWVLLRYRFAE